MQALGARLLGQQPCAQHHVGIAGVGAARDGCDHHVSMGDFVILARDRHALLRIIGRDAKSLGQIIEERSGCIFQEHPILRTLGPGDARHDGRQVQLDNIRVYCIRCSRIDPHTLRLGISLDQLHARFIPPG